MRVSRQTSNLCGARCLRIEPVPQAHSVNLAQVRNCKLIGEWHAKIAIKMYSNSLALMSLFCIPISYILSLPSLLQPASPTSREAVYRTCTPDTPVSPRRLARERAVVPSASEKTTVTQVSRWGRREEGRRKEGGLVIKNRTVPY